jgi:hypothetical protein
LKIPKRSETVNLETKDYTMVKRRRTKEQNIDLQNTTQKTKVTSAPQFLFH